MRYMTHCEYGETVLETPRGRGLDRTAALKAITQGRSVIYAVRLSDGIIKIGCSKSLWNRRRAWAAEILGFRFGDMREEQEIHQSLQAHVARGREYYHPTPEVLAFVNELRDEWGLDHL